MTAQISLVKHDHPFNISTLPRRARRRQYLLDAHGLNLVNEALPEGPIAAAKEIA